MEHKPTDMSRRICNRFREGVIRVVVSQLLSTCLPRAYLLDRRHKAIDITLKGRLQVIVRSVAFRYTFLLRFHHGFPEQAGIWIVFVGCLPSHVLARTRRTCL